MCTEKMKVIIELNNDSLVNLETDIKLALVNGYCYPDPNVLRIAVKSIFSVLEDNGIIIK